MKNLKRVVNIAFLACSMGAVAQTDTYGAGSPPPESYSNPPAPQPPLPPPPSQTTVVVKERGDKRPCACGNDADKWGDMRGFSIMAGGGMEGYTGSLAPRIKAGAAWEVAVQVKPTSVLGIELAYSGAANSFQPNRLGGGHAGLVRNGGQAAITAGLSATRVQPYILLGIGVQRYSLDNVAEAFGYRSVTNGYIPLGAGLRTYFAGRFTLDLRATYNVDFGDTIYASLNTSSIGSINTSLASSGRWRGTVSIGYTF